MVHAVLDLPPSYSSYLEGLVALSRGTLGGERHWYATA